MAVITLEFSGGVKVAPSVQASLDTSTLGSVLASVLEDGEDATFHISALEKELAGPLLQFLETGSYVPAYTGPPTPDVVESEAACYKAVCTEELVVPGFISDVECVLYNRLMSGHARLWNIRAKYAGYNRIESICGVVGHDIGGISHGQLLGHLLEDGALFIFHRDPMNPVETVKMTLVVDLTEKNVVYERMKTAYADRGWFTGGTNPSSNRFMSFTTIEPVDVEYLTTGEWRTQHMIDVIANTPWQQVGDDGIRFPVFPSCATINLVVGAGMLIFQRRAV